MASSGVTFKVASHPAEVVRSASLSTPTDNVHLMVSRLKEYSQEGCGRVLQATSPLTAPDASSCFVPSDNGFVRGVVQAYCHHHNLLIRPDDVWLSIIIQFGFYVNGESEALRSIFVSHQGKKELKVSQIGSLDTVDYGRFARDMTSKLRDNLNDPAFCDWVLPRFSTTTHNDTIVGSVALMATMKQYFDYKSCLCCGIPEITLEGTVEDWEEIDARVEKLEVGGYGKSCVSWAVMLKKIIRHFIQASRNEVDMEFWSRICHYTPGGSGPSYLSGWITTFCVFDGKGKWQANNFSIPRRGFRLRGDHNEPEPPVVLEFPVIDTSDIPPGYITVDVTVDDNGKEYKSLMFAGHMGYHVVHQGKGISPKLAWAIALKSEGNVQQPHKSRPMRSK